MSDASPAPSAPRDPVTRAALLVDSWILRVEEALVTLTALVMTATVSLDIVYRSFASEESQIAKKLLTPLGWIGVERSDANYEFLRDYVTPTILVVLTFLAGWAVFVSADRRREQRRPGWMGVASGALAVAIGYGFVEFVLHVPSRWVCATFLVAGCLGYLSNSLRRGDRVGAGLAVLIGGFGAWSCRLLPPDYIWSQELSLILLVWMAFIGASMATRTGKHIQVDALSRLIPASARPWTRALGLAVTAFFCGYLSVLAYDYVFGPTGNFHSGEIRPATGLPGWTGTIAMLVALSLITLRYSALAVDAFRNPKIIERGLTH